jgi:hypothetical protein
MQDPSIVNRLEILERKVELLDALPARVSAVESQIVQLRHDMNAGFSALREEMRTGLEVLRTDLRAEIRAGDEETRHFMRILHEDVIARIAAIRLG